MLLRRYGVVFREVLARESILPDGAKFSSRCAASKIAAKFAAAVSSAAILGEQFAMPMAVESLRAARKQQPANERITLSAADPLNLIGSVVPGERVPAISNRSIAYVDGIPAELDDEPTQITHPLAAS